MGNSLQKFQRSDVSVFSTKLKCSLELRKKMRQSKAAEGGQGVSRPADARGDAIVPPSPPRAQLSFVLENLREARWLSQGGYVLGQAKSKLWNFYNYRHSVVPKQAAECEDQAAIQEENRATADTSASSEKPPTATANKEVTVFWKEKISANLIFSLIIFALQHPHTHT